MKNDYVLRTSFFLVHPVDPRLTVRLMILRCYVLTLTLHCWHLAGVNQLCLSFTHSVQNQFSVDNGHTL